MKTITITSAAADAPTDSESCTVGRFKIQNGESNDPGVLCWWKNGILIIALAYLNPSIDELCRNSWNQLYSAEFSYIESISCAYEDHERWWHCWNKLLKELVMESACRKSQILHFDSYRDCVSDHNLYGGTLLKFFILNSWKTTSTICACNNVSDRLLPRSVKSFLWCEKKYCSRMNR